MKKLLLALLLACALPVDAGNTFFWRCEGTTLDATHDHSAGDTTATAFSAIAIDATSALVGSNGCNANAGSDDNYNFASASIFSTAQGAAAFKVQVKTWGDDTSILSIYNAGAPSDQIILELEGTDELLMRHRVNGGDNNTHTTSASNLVINTTYIFVIRWNVSTSTRRIETYTSGGTLIEGISATSPALSAQGALTIFEFGTGGGGGRFWLDNLVVGDAYADPVETWANYTSYTQIGGSSNAPRAMHYKRLLGMRDAANDDQFLLRASR